MDPAMVRQVLALLSQQNPQLATQIAQNPQMLQQVMAQMGGGHLGQSHGGQGGRPGGG
jgi:hypothetical protein